MEKEEILIIDFGGQYNQLIARRVREKNVFCEVVPCTISIDKIKEKNMLKESDGKKIFDNLAYVMAELNIIHPFREGNGRSIREFIRLMAKRVGCDLNWGNIEKEKLLEASILSVDNYKVLIAILDTCVD